jgi:hypothetical protein
MDVFAVTEALLPEPPKGDGHDSGNDNIEKGGEEANKFQRAISAWRGEKNP